MVNRGAEVSPGPLPPISGGGGGAAGIGTLAIARDYIQQTGGTLVIDLAGPAPGAGHDVLEVDRNAILAGTLDLRIADGFEPVPGQSFTILAADSVSGQFESIACAEVLQIDYGPDEVTVSVARQIVPSDLNCDGVVGVEDLLQLLSAWGPCRDTGTCPADLDDDGLVGVSDLLELLRAWSA